MRAWILTGVVLAGCSEARTFYPLEAAAYQYAFSVVLDAAGTRLRLTDPAPMSGSLVLGLEAEASAVLLVGFDDDALAESSQLFAPELVTKLSVEEVGTADCPSGRWASDESALIPIPKDAEIFRISIDDEADPVRTELAAEPSLSNVSIRIPIEPRRCAGTDQLELRPFGPSAFPFQGRPRTVAGVTRGDPFPRIRNVQGVTDDRLIASTDELIFLLDRNADFPQTPDRAVNVGAARAVTAMTLDSTDRSKAIAVGWKYGATEGFIWDLVIESDRPVLVRTATVQASLSAVAMDRQGRLVTVGNESIFVRRTYDSPLEEYEAPQVQLNTILPHSDGTFLIGGFPGVILRSSPDLSSWTRVDADLTELVGFTVWSFAEVESSPRPLWLAGTEGYLGEWDEERQRFESTPLMVMPHAFSSCESRPASCGGVENLETLFDILPHVSSDGTSRVFGTMKFCAAVFVAPADRSCASFVPIPGLELLDGRNVYTETLVSDGDRMLLGSDHGAIFELRLDQEGKN